MVDESGNASSVFVRILRWVVLLPLALLILLFVVDNRQVVTVDLPLTGFSLQSPLFLILLLVFLCGLGIGGVAAWLSSFKWRRLARRERRAREMLARDVEGGRIGQGRAPLAPPSPYLPPDA
jgi:uncharacterized integral membrane protein